MRAVLAWLCLLAAAPAPGQVAVPAPAPAPTESPGDDVVVTATRRRCDLSIADRILSNREFRARAAQWAAGRPVRIAVPDSASYKCQARIVFRLSKYGVRRAVFVSP